MKILITGGASGIGKLIAKQYILSHNHVIIWDYSSQNIATTLAELLPLGKINAYKVDISDHIAVQNAANNILNQFGPIDILINNAGIVVGKNFIDTTTSEINNTMNININGAMYVTNAFLPSMLAQNSGHICNIASSAGYITNPKMSVYVASKWAMVGWSDSIRIELKNKNINVTTVMPYYINTGMFDGVKSKIPILEPQFVATKIVRAIHKNKKIFSINPWMYRTTRLAQAILPIKILDFLLEKVFDIYSTMNNFVGHNKPQTNPT